MESMESTTEKPTPEYVAAAARSGGCVRSEAPVFVLGCPRSGTTVLFHMLLSAGNFAVYRAESNVFSVLQPRFGNLHSENNRHELLRYWLKSKLFQVTGLEPGPIAEKILRECHGAGDFLRIVMEETARHQGVTRWADSTPDHLLYIPQIKHEIPDALIVHIIRDGRDVALSYAKQGWAYPLPWDRNEQVVVAGLFWEWIVGKGRNFGRALGRDYYELHYEDLVEKPRETLRALGDFIGQELDYDHILRIGIGSVSEPNSSFVSGPGGGFQPVQRWTKQMTTEQLENFEALVGKFLQVLGYPLSGGQKSNFRQTRLRHTYRAWFATRHWLKSKTPLGRLSGIERLGVEGNSNR
jgi:Sulfotransferase family